MLIFHDIVSQWKGKEMNAPIDRYTNIKAMRLSPILKWAGGKEQELKHIHPNMPKKIKNYYEPFIGGGAVYFSIEADKLFINDKWVKATPAFNKELCKKFNVKSLDFDGENDSVFQGYTESGDKYMDYLVDHGTFANMPFELMITLFKKAYPLWYAELKQGIPERTNNVE